MTQEKLSKSTRLIYIVIIMWVYFGVLGLFYEANLAQLAGYYASLTLFVSTFLWGEYKRLSQKSNVFKKGESSAREIVIYLTLLLWWLTGTFGVVLGADINQLTVFFAALTPFVSSYIIYKTGKGNDLPIFNGESEKLKNNSLEKSGLDTKIKTINKPDINPSEEDVVVDNNDKKIVEEDEVF